MELLFEVSARGNLREGVVLWATIKVVHIDIIEGSVVAVVEHIG